MSEFKKRVLDPIMPLFVVVAFVGVVVFSVSRILLAAPEKGSVIIALVLATDILFIAAIIAAARRVKAAQRGLLIFMALALVGGGIASGATFGTRPVEEFVTGVPLAAKNLAFLEKQITLKAGSENTIAFMNEDAGTPHNVAIATDQKRTNLLFQGAVVTGVTKAAYKVPPLDAGTYFFFCEVHPFMTGTLEVSNNPPPPSPGSGR